MTKLGPPCQLTASWVRPMEKTLAVEQTMEEEEAGICFFLLLPPSPKAYALLW
jgi:hypothetical protein